MCVCVCSPSVIIALDNFAVGDVISGFNGKFVWSGGVTSRYKSFRDVISSDVTSGIMLAFGTVTSISIILSW